MDIASALWAIKNNGLPVHIPAVEGFLTHEGKEICMTDIQTRIEEIKHILKIDCNKLK